MTRLWLTKGSGKLSPRFFWAFSNFAESWDSVLQVGYTFWWSKFHLVFNFFTWRWSFVQMCIPCQPCHQWMRKAGCLLNLLLCCSPKLRHWVHEWSLRFWCNGWAVLLKMLLGCPYINFRSPFLTWWARCFKWGSNVRHLH